jgi:hypothetical protein
METTSSVFTANPPADGEFFGDHMGNEKRNLGIGCLVLIAIVVILGVLLSQCSSSDSDNSANTYVHAGDRGYINVDTYAAVTKKDMDLLTSYFNAKNYDGISEMIQEGKVFEVEKGTAVNVIDRTLTAAQVKSGTLSGWVPVEFVSKYTP